MECYTCRHERQIDTLPARELVAADGHWRVARDRLATALRARLL